MKTWLFLLTALTIALAGCSDKGSTPDGDDDDFGPPVDVDKDKGVMRGVIVDEAIRPLANVRVTAVGGEGETSTVEATTEADGVFVFGPLAPGSYIVRAEKLGHVATQTSTNVEPGVATPKPLRLILVVDPETRPYASTTKLAGFIECSVRAYDSTGATGTLPIFNEPFYAGHNTCSLLGDAGNQETEFPIEFDAPPTFVQGELRWTSSQATGSGLTLVVGPQTCLDIKWGRADGTSPLVVGLNQTVLEENRDEGSDEGTCFRVFSWVAPETSNFAGAAISQEFELFLTTFYNFVPEPEWTFIEHGEPTPPQ